MSDHGSRGQAHGERLACLGRNKAIDAPEHLRDSTFKLGKSGQIRHGLRSAARVAIPAVRVRGREHFNIGAALLILIYFRTDPTSGDY